MNDELEPDDDMKQDVSFESENAENAENTIISPEEENIEEENLKKKDLEEKKQNENDELKESDSNENKSKELEKEEELEEPEKLKSAEELEDELKTYQRNLIEAALYASDESLSIEMLSAKLDISKNEVDDLIHELQEIYEQRNTALILKEIGDKYQMSIKSEYMEVVSQFAEGGGIAEKYLRTLTIIALKQPLLKSTLVKIRGTGAYEHVKYLEDNLLIDSIKKGRTSELTTTDKFAEMFGLPKNVQEMKKIMVDQGLGLPEEAIKENKEL
jgi:segregation and condensation protein B